MPYFDDLKTVRERAGIRIATLSRKAEVDRSTISRIEKHHNATPETLHAIVNALNALGCDVIYEKVVTTTSKFGEKDR